MNLASARATSVLKVVLFAASLVPLARLLLDVLGVGGLTLGANPVEELIHRLGKWGLNFLLITLAVTPVRRLTGLHWLVRYRRMLGLFTFFYITLHFESYTVVDHRLDISSIGEDIIERPYITLGVTALILLVPLAVTSTNGMMRRLGSRWRRLHRLVYVIAVLGVSHFYWQVKQDVQEPLIYAGILAVLLGFRVWVATKSSRHRLMRAA